MKLIFENSYGEERVIAEPQTEEEAWKYIHQFCKERNFKIYYVRGWMDNNNRITYDVGSHTEFFHLEK